MNRQIALFAVAASTGIEYRHEALGKGFGPGFKVIGGHDFINNDSSRANFIPPTVTALFVLDSAGRALRELAPHGSAALWYRYAGTTTWTPLSLTQMTEDAGAPGRLGGGVLFRADLTPVANIDSGKVDLKIDLQDPSGHAARAVDRTSSPGAAARSPLTRST